MKVLFVGVGSIAKRHIRNLIDLYGKDNIQIDALRRADYGKPDGIARVLTDYDSIEEKYDAIFITNPTEKHIETIERLKDKTDAFFIEKPINSCPLDDIAGFEDGKIYYVACPLRYTKIIQYLKESIEPASVLSVRAISSSYLPEWREGVDYRNTYSAHKELGGGVSIDLIHEWDYLTYLFGMPQKISKLITKKSDLELDCEDVALYLAEYEDKVVELHLDYFGRYPIRRLELITKEDTVECDLIRGKVAFLKARKELDLRETRDDYCKRELKRFFAIIHGDCRNENSIEHANEILKLAR